MSALRDRSDTRIDMLIRVSGGLGMMSGLVLIAMMLLICLGVALRYVLNAPIAGANEILELASVTCVMLALPYCTANDAHIRIDLADGVLGSVGIALTELLSRALGIIVVWFLVKAALKRAEDAFEFEDATNMVSIPLWPFYGVLAAGFTVFAMILLIQAVTLVVQMGARHD